MTRVRPAMLDSILHAGELRELLKELECDLGLHDLSRVERDLIYAMHVLGRRTGQVSTAELWTHPLIEDLNQATFHRAIRELIDRGMIRREPGERARYALLAAAPRPS